MFLYMRKCCVLYMRNYCVLYMRKCCLSCSGQRILEDFEEHVAKEESERDRVRDMLEKSSKVLTDVKIGVEHLAHKLHHLKAVRTKRCAFTSLSHCSLVYLLALYSFVFIKNFCSGYFASSVDCINCLAMYLVLSVKCTLFKSYCTLLHTCQLWCCYIKLYVT